MGQRVRDILTSGQIGDIRLITSSFSFFLANPSDIRLNPDFGGGSLYDVGCYCVHAIRTVSGNGKLKKVHAVARLAKDGCVDTSLTAALEFSNGVLAHLDCSFEVQRRQFLQIAGSEGTLILSCPFRPDFGNPTLELKTADENRIESFEQFNMYKAEVEHFSDCVQKRRVPDNFPDESIQIMQILDEIYRDIGRRGFE